jgi:ATP-dependent protease ClpP protease subunit
MGTYLPLPYVYEREGRQERAWDIYSRLLRDRIVFIGTPIDDFVANSIIAQLATKSSIGVPMKTMRSLSKRL